MAMSSASSGRSAGSTAGESASESADRSGLSRTAIESLVRAALKATPDPADKASVSAGAKPADKTAVNAADKPLPAAAHVKPIYAPPATPLVSAGQVLLPPSSLRDPHDPAALRRMQQATPARVAVGRVGTRYTTATLLRFRADHAAAKDAVMSEVKPELLARLGFVEVRSQARDKRHFLQRPDAGRALSDEARKTLADKLPKSPRLQIIYGDGLSAEAINTNLEPLHTALVKELGARGIPAGTPLYIHLSRVKIMDEVARLVDCEAAIFICGERPGLGFADSLSAYYIYKPATGATDADREVISNINPRGFPPVQAAQQLAENVVRILRDRKSGVVFAK